MITNGNLFGVRNKLDEAINRIRTFEPEDGYFLAFSGGKDSQVVYHLAVEAGVKFDAHYQATTVDPPELVRHIKKNYPDVIFDRPEKTMWQLIVDHKMPPTRVVRYCCSELKEGGGRGRLVMTGVRRAESSKRKNRALLTINQNTKSEVILNNDNEESRQLFEQCIFKGKCVLNPIIDWTDKEVWEYIRLRSIEYCSLYDEGFKRLGCIGCPLAGPKQMKVQFLRWPQFERAYMLTFDRMLTARQNAGLDCCEWPDAESVMEWWTSVKALNPKPEIEHFSLERFMEVT